LQEYSLEFCDFIYHDNGILEVIVKEGVEITAESAHQFLHAIEQMQPKVTAALVNRKHPYSYTFQANLILAGSKVVEDVAVVKYTKMSWPLKGVFFPKFYHLAFFDNYEEASEWLLAKLKKRTAASG